MAKRKSNLKCLNCGADLIAPASIHELTVQCQYCQGITELPDRERRLAAQERQRQQERWNATAQDNDHFTKSVVRWMVGITIAFVVIAFVATFLDIFYF